jgi:sugar phosphate isomerase/epimerase
MAKETFRDRSPITQPSRRALLAGGAAGLAGLAGPRLARAAAKPRTIPIALQLWSVRDEVGKDLDGTLKKVAEMGFQGVEFAGYHKYKDDPAGLRKKLDELGLKAAGTHIPAGSFEPDKIGKTIEFHKALGCRFLIVPGDRRFNDPEKSKEYARLLTDAAVALKKEGLFCGHHNHTQEFDKVGDKTYWDLFAERTSKDVILQQDIGWTTMAGLDPVALVKRHPGRTRTCHIKAKLPKGTQGKRPILGEDVVDWKRVIAALAASGGTEWLVVEQEDYPDGLSPMETTKRSLDGLKKILGTA